MMYNCHVAVDGFMGIIDAVNPCKMRIDRFAASPLRDSAGAACSFVYPEAK